MFYFHSAGIRLLSTHECVCPKRPSDPFQPVPPAPCLRMDVRDPACWSISYSDTVYLPLPVFTRMCWVLHCCHFLFHLDFLMTPLRQSSDRMHATQPALTLPHRVTTTAHQAQHAFGAVSWMSIPHTHESIIMPYLPKIIYQKLLGWNVCK